MRLRKNMKRTAAAVLALSMAVSAVAAPASAAYICDVSKGNVEISVDADGNKSIKVDGKEVEDIGDEKGKIIIIGDNTGDNTKPTESQNAEEENTSEVEKSGENASEVEKSGETEEQAQEPGSLELLAPEDEEKKDEQKKTEQKPADSQEPEQTEKTEKTSDQVIEYGQYDPEAQKEAAKPAVKPAAEQKAEEKKAAEEKIYEATNAPTTLTEKAQEAARNVVKIINDYASPLKVILRNLKVDAGDTKESAVTVSGTGNVTLELDGKNELTGGTGTVENEYIITRARAGLKSEMGKTTITDSDGDGTLIATGGTIVVDDSYASAKSGQYAAGFGIDGAVIAGGTVVAKGGDVKFESSAEQKENSYIFFSTGSGILTPEISGGIVEATGGSAIGNGTLGALSEAGSGVGGEDYSAWIQTKITGGTVKATGGNAKNSGGSRGGFGIRVDYNNGKGGLSISGGTVIAQGGTGDDGGSGISSAKISGGSVMAVGGAGIKNGGDGMGGATISDGSVVAVGGTGSKTGGDGFDKDSTVKVTGGKVTAQGGKGGSEDGVAAGKNVTVFNPGSVTKGDSNHVHQYSEGDIVKKATCTSEGYKLKKCSKCGAEELEHIAIDPEAHNWVESEHKDATCTEDGYTEYKCSACGETKRDNIISATGEHHFTVVKEVVAPTYTSEGYTIYKCETCDETEKRDVVPMLAPESNGGSSAVTLTVTGAGAYETSIAEGRYVVAVPAEAAVLSGCLGNLKELKAQGVNTIVFRTQLRETALNIDSMLSLGVDNTLFTLTHSGESAELTVGGFAHNELLH